MKRVLFLCSANYYRSRFAEHFFNWLAEQEGLPWQADSRGLAVDKWPDLDQMSDYTIEALALRGIAIDAVPRNPKQVSMRDLGGFDLVIAVKESEHRSMMTEKFPLWADRIEYWQIDDIDCAPPCEALPILEERIRQLVEALQAVAA
ncbi:MAG: arsenate-mycothiol transferase ArsC [Thermoguttaceae bacterium]